MAPANQNYTTTGFRPPIWLTREAYSKIMHWVNKSNMEVSGFGKVITMKNDKGLIEGFVVRDVYLLKQTVGMAHTDIDAAAFGKLMYETKDAEGDLNFQWHSHVNMAVFWSQTDVDTILELGGNGYCLAGVFNKKNEHRFALSYKIESTFGMNTLMEDQMTATIYDHVDETKKKEWDEEFTQKVSEEKWTAPATQGTFSGNWNSSKSHRKALKEIRRAIHRCQMPKTLAQFEKMMDDIDLYTRNKTRDPLIVERAVVIGVYPYELDEVYKELSKNEIARLDTLVDEFIETGITFGSNTPFTPQLPAPRNNVINLSEYNGEVGDGDDDDDFIDDYTDDDPPPQRDEKDFDTEEDYLEYLELYKAGYIQ